MEQILIDWFVVIALQGRAHGWRETESLSQLNFFLSRTKKHTDFYSEFKLMWNFVSGKTAWCHHEIYGSSYQKMTRFFSSTTKTDRTCNYHEIKLANIAEVLEYFNRADIAQVIVHSEQECECAVFVMPTERKSSGCGRVCRSANTTGKSAAPQKRRVNLPLRKNDGCRPTGSSAWNSTPFFISGSSISSRVLFLLSGGEIYFTA